MGTETTNVFKGGPGFAMGTETTNVRKGGPGFALVAEAVVDAAQLL